MLDAWLVGREASWSCGTSVLRMFSGTLLHYSSLRHRSFLRLYKIPHPWLQCHVLNTAACFSADRHVE